MLMSGAVKGNEGGSLDSLRQSRCICNMHVAGDHMSAAVFLVRLNDHFISVLQERPALHTEWPVPRCSVAGSTSRHEGGCGVFQGVSAQD